MFKLSKIQYLSGTEKKKLSGTEHFHRLYFGPKWSIKTFGYKTVYHLCKIRNLSKMKLSGPKVPCVKKLLYYETSGTENKYIYQTNPYKFDKFFKKTFFSIK